MKDHEIAKLVNKLTEIAKTYGQTEQLRCRISEIILDECELGNVFSEYHKPGWRDPSTAPKDGRLLRLLVAFTDNNIEDTPDPQETIGHNSFKNTGVDTWSFAGWNWTHDVYSEGHGEVLGWLPMESVKP